MKIARIQMGIVAIRRYNFLYGFSYKYKGENCRSFGGVLRLRSLLDEKVTCFFPIVLALPWTDHRSIYHQQTVWSVDRRGQRGRLVCRSAVEYDLFGLAGKYIIQGMSSKLSTWWDSQPKEKIRKSEIPFGTGILVWIFRSLIRWGVNFTCPLVARFGLKPRNKNPD